MSNDREERDDVEADVLATMRELRGEGGPVEGAEVAAAAPPAAETAEQKQARIDAAGRVRDESGRFAPKAASKADEIVAGTDKLLSTQDPAKKLAEEEAAKGAQPLQPPSHWSVEAKAAFVNAPRPLQEQALKREQEISEKAKEWQGKSEDYNRLNRVIGPNLDRWARQGRAPDAAINQLISFERALETNPVSAVHEILRVFAPGNELQVINQIARANGLQLVQAGNQGEAARGQGPAQADPTVGRLYEQVQSLTNHLTQQQQAAANSYRQQVLSEVQAFAADPAHLYYENVKGIIARLVTEGDEKGDTRPIQVRLKEAYEQAVWADPTTRPLMLQEQQRRAAAEEAKRVQAARHAGGSVAGSPEHGVFAPGNRGSHRDNIEDDVRQAYLELAGR